jgi:hypothetical protein
MTLVVSHAKKKDPGADMSILASKSIDNEGLH